MADYVLSRFPKEDLPAIRESVSKAADAVVTIIEDGADKAMNLYN